MRIRDYVNQMSDSSAVSLSSNTTLGAGVVGFLSWAGSINWVGLISVLVAVIGLATNIYFSWRDNKRKEELHRINILKRDYE